MRAAVICAVRAAEVLGDAVIVPLHGEGWAHFSETLDYLARNFDYAGRADQPRIPVAGEVLTVATG
ncbi:hypothetical protein HLB23_21620 [Nocardia uniformis]|uniref:Uncharacterized protein n=1 Tax=Nocardia uniformis TaxID=53432 RepID=A0A849C482_9NOCA|nr:hypothetical protein [Nocardia uniformis]NNH72426.1 hypothetical protein [Nocardia uniformis]